MSHRAEIVDKSSVSNGVIAVTLRCCGDAGTDSRATLHVTPGVDVAAWAAGEKDRVQAEHQAMQDAHATLADL